MAGANVSRRLFLTLTAGASAVALSRSSSADESITLGGGVEKTIDRPRATSGDKAVEPKWEEKLTLTVGPKEADIIGTSHKALQAAVNYVASLGGGTVQVLPGRYELRGGVTLQSNVRILGSGEDSLLIKNPSHSTKLAVDSDWYDQEITLVDPKGFEVGDTICLRCKNPHNGGQEVAKRTLVARSGNRFKLDKALRQNFWQMGEATCWSLFPILTGEEIENIAIENIFLDGNKQNNANLDGNHAGCVFLQDCRDIVMRGVTARNYNGDGLSWQICHDVLVENCRSHDHTGLGLHPGSGSQRPIMRNNVIERNNIGIFFCWGVKYGLAEGNQLDGNVTSISLGHRDTDNLVRKNTVRNSGQVAVLFRPERGAAFCAHRNVIEENTLINSGGKDAAAIDVQGGTESVTIRKNDIQETRGAEQRIGIRLGAETKELTVAENKISGVATEILKMS